MRNVRLGFAYIFARGAKRVVRGARQITPGGAARGIAKCLLATMGLVAWAQAVSTTTVQGTVYLANGKPGAGTLVLNWPAFTTAGGQVIAADSTTMTIPSDGFVSVNLAPNQGATPAGEYYTAVLYMSDGTVNTQYWVVPAAAQASLAQVQAQVMPAAQAVQTVSKSFVDQAIAELAGSELSASGGTLSGPLYLSGDPAQALQAADKHYVDAQVATALPLAGGTLSGPFSATQIGAAHQVDQFPGADFGAKLQACLSTVSGSYGGTCDARNFTGNLSMGSTATISTGNTVVLLPCATIATANQLVITAGTRNVALRGCAMRGGSAASGSVGGTVLAYSGAAAMVTVGDPTYALDTPGFHMDNVVINTTSATSAMAQGLAAYRTQEMDLEDMYFLGNANQTGMTLDGTGNYSGGTFRSDQFSGFQTAVNAIGHQVANPATTDWMNASTFVRIHIDCPTANGSPMNGTYGINLQQGDGNTFTGGDVEGCATAVHLGANAQNNTIVGLRNENSTNQVVADAGSSYNNWMTGGTMFTGQLVDNGTRNSFWDTFHRSFNGLNGDWFGSQQDTTLTNHFRLGIGTGNERGLLNRYQTDSGYRWTMGLSDATGGEQFYQVLDELNNVYRLSIGQYNHGQAGTNNQTVVNAAGTGAVVLNGSNGAGTGGVIIGSGGPSETSVATINNAGNAQFNGNLQVGGSSQSTGTMTVRNSADAEVDYYLWPGLTTSQKGSFTYKEWNGNSQWYMVKDASNNWALNSAIGGLDSLKAYQSTNSGDTYINSSNSTGHVRLNYESGAGAETDIYSGSSANLDAAFLGPTSIKFPGLAATSGNFCMQIDTSGYLTNTGAACGSGSGGSNGTINSGNTGQIAYYTGSGTAIGGMNAVPLSAGGTGATSAATALGNLLPGVAPDGNNGLDVTGSVLAARGSFSGSMDAAVFAGSAAPMIDIRNSTFASGAVCDGTTNHPIDAAVQAVLNSCSAANGCNIQIVGNPQYCYLANPPALTYPGGGVVTLFVQGELRTGTSLALPTYTSSDVSLIGNGGNDAAASFLPVGESAYILVQPPTGTGTGTLGTAVTATGAPTTFTPSSMSGLVAGAGITIVDTTACTISSITRASNLVTATLSAACHIPAGVGVTVAGVTDSSFNGSYFTGGAPSQFFVNSSDYVLNTLTWNQTGSNAASSGGTATGLLEDSVENVALTSCTGSTCTATFNRTHAAAAQWGVDGITTPTPDTQSRVLRNFTVVAPGTGLWLAQDYLTKVENVAVSATGACSGNPANWDVELGYSSFITMDHVAFTGGCLPWSIRLTQPSNQSYTGSGPIYLDHSFIMSGIKLDHGASAVYAKNTVFEQATRGAVQVDPTNYWNANQNIISIENSGMQDNPYGFNSCFIYYETPVNQAVSDYPLPLANVTLKQLGSGSCMTNDYFTGAIDIDTPNAPASYDLNTARGVQGVYNDGKVLDAEVRGEQAPMGPTVVPVSTASVTTNPSNWTGSCSVAPVMGPDGVTGSAGALTIGGGAGNILVGSQTITPAAGGRFLYGGWVYTPTHGVAAQSGGSGTAFSVTVGGTNFSIDGYGGNQDETNPWDSAIVDDGWHPIVGVANIVTANGGSGTVSLYMGCDQTKTMEYFMPFMTAYIPPSVSLAEVNRWRRNLLHGAVPPGYTGGLAHAASVEQIDAPGYNILNPATGTVTPLGTASLNDWTDSGAATGNVPVWNATTGKWMPGSVNAAQVNGASVPSSANVLGANSSGQMVSATAAQIVSAIGAVAISNATTAANFTGSLSGDVTGTQGATSVIKVNGASIPSSANALATNSSSQPVAATSHNLSVPANCVTTGSANTYSCSTSPSFTPAAGDHIQVEFNVANTGTSTLAVNGASAAAIRKWGSSSTLAANDVLAGHWISATYDGTYWQLEGQLGNANSTQVNGASVPASASVVGTNGSGQLVNMTVPTLSSVAQTSSTTLTSTGLVLPSVTANTTVHGTCAIIWEGSSTSYTTTFGLGANNAPTNLWVLGTMHGGANGGTLADKYTAITNATATAVTTAGTPGTATTGYRADLDFTLVTGSNPVTLTLYYESSNASGTSSAEPGSACWWL